MFAQGCYLGEAGVNPSRLRPGSGFGLGFGAFLVSFLPLSLFPMGQECHKTAALNSINPH
jgi:hypothetical protein